MSNQRLKMLTAGAVALTLVAAACGSDDDTPAATDAPPVATDAMSDDEMTECESIDEVSLQLQWFTQAQFAGYYAAH